ncbi:response regulator [Thermodesulfobacteriota bacterium]
MGRIVVVDDEVEVCNALKEFLSSREYEVETALDGRTALKKIEEFNPHIVLLDIMMPGMGGMDILIRIRNINPKTGIIMVTAIADEGTAKYAFDLGAYDYITKPLDLNYLETVVRAKMIDIIR